MHLPLPVKLPVFFSVLLAALFFAAPAQAQTQSSTANAGMPAGAVQPAVKVLADASYTYALYLPSQYSPQKRWPVLLAFDPSGEGEYPVRLFQPAAEKYGFILVGSNNSRNFVDPSAAIRLLWHDVTTRYAVDPRRVYATGFSGGSRVASGLAIGCKNCLAGVIACGAGLPPGVGLPAADTADWFLAAGTLDFNYAEMIQLADSLDSRHAATHLAFFPGPHHWMSAAVAEEALAWMHLRAIAKGTAPVDKDFVEREFTRQVLAAQALEQSGNTVGAFRASRQIANDFRTLRDIKDVQTKQDALAKSDELKRSRKNEQALFELQDKTSVRINGITNAIINKDKPTGILYHDLELLTAEIRHDRDTTQDTARRDALVRGMAGAFAYARETGSDDLLKKDYVPARDLFRATAIMRPEAAWPHYLIALAAARLGENKLALEELGKSVDMGLDDPQLFESAELDPLRGNDAFKGISARLAHNAAKSSN
jgi:dienelactone hydrolase